MVIAEPRVGATTWSAAYMGSSSMGLMTEVIDVENWRIENSRVLRWIVSLIKRNSSVSLTKSSIQNGKCSAQFCKGGVLRALMHYFDRVFNSFNFGEKCGAQRLGMSSSEPENEEEMSSKDDQFISMKAFMAIAEDEPFVGKNDATSCQ
ncbi:hypothetical protein Tco_0787270 [Tanacetum coccineum]